MSEDNGTTVVLLPTYNEAGNLENMVVAIRAQLPQAHVLVIDDNSPDGTGDVADRCAARDSLVHVAHRPGKQGLGVAYRWGYGWALDHGHAFVIQMDCDFSHDPADLPRLRALLDTHPAVVGSRRVAGGGSANWPWYRNLISTAGSYYARTVLSSPVHDLTTGFKGFRREALEKLDVQSLRSDGFGFQIEVTASLLALGVPVYEMPIIFSDRKWGESKMSSKIFLEAMVKVWQVRNRARTLRAARA